MKNGRIIGAVVIGVGSATIAAATIGTAVLEKLNENEESKFKRVRNTIGFCAAVFATGYTLTTIFETNENQIRFVEAIQNSVSKTEA